MKFLRRLVYLLIIILVISAKSELAGNYVSDFKVLITSLEELHPMLYNVIGKEHFNFWVQETELKLAAAHSRNEAMYLMQSFLFRLGDGHTSTLDAFSDKSAERILPFKVVLLNNGIYIKKLDADSNYNGARIWSINNTPAWILLDSLNIFYTNDGARNLIGHGLSSLFNSLYASFCQQPDTFRIETDHGSLLLPAVKKGDKKFAELIAYKWFEGNDKYLKKYITPDFGYFRFLEFEKKSGGFSIEKEFDNFMEEVIKQKKKAVVIDLRYNAGGVPEIAARMAGYLLDSLPPTFQTLYVTSMRKPEFFQYMDHKFRFHFLHFGTTNQDSVLQKIRFERGLKKEHVHKPRFSGDVYIITSEMTASAATMFCSYLMNSKHVVFVGSETGGAINYFWAHKHCNMQLPYSGIRVTFPMELIELEKGSCRKEKPKELIPDKKITYTIEEYLAGIDKEMAWIKSDVRSRY